jgi:hypothetical protein
VLVQYVPHAFGWKAMNLPFCLWLHAWHRGPIDVMFHEVVFPMNRAQPWKHNLIGLATRAMAALVARRADRAFVSVPGWGPLLRRYAPRRRPATWLPVPSNLPADVPAEAVARLRRRLAPAGEMIVGHFGTYGALVAPLLERTIPEILRPPGRVGLLLGRDGDRFAAELARAHPHLVGRLIGPGELPAERAAEHLAACDVLVQPYPDGISSRRTSVMSGLAAGVPVVSTTGILTEDVWAATGAALLAPADQPGRLTELVGELLADPRRRAALGARGRALYREQFAVERTIERLRRC